MAEWIKPPLGVSPHWFVYRQRIEELNKAISRYLEHIEKKQHIAELKQDYEAIADWAKEIQHLALLEADLHGTPKERGTEHLFKCETCRHCKGGIKCDTFCDTGEQYIPDMSKIPTADVVEVKHGEWIYHECVSSYEGAISGYSCSVCSAFVNEEVFESNEFHKDFCGSCGAKMKRSDTE